MPHLCDEAHCRWGIWVILRELHFSLKKIVERRACVTTTTLTELDITLLIELLYKKNIVQSLHYNFQQIPYFISVSLLLTLKILYTSQPAFTCSKLRIETLEQDVKYMKF